MDIWIDTPKYGPNRDTYPTRKSSTFQNIVGNCWTNWTI